MNLEDSHLLDDARVLRGEERVAKDFYEAARTARIAAEARLWEARLNAVGVHLGRSKLSRQKNRQPDSTRTFWLPEGLAERHAQMVLLCRRLRIDGSRTETVVAFTVEGVIDALGENSAPGLYRWRRAGEVS